METSITGVSSSTAKKWGQIFPWAFFAHLSPGLAKKLGGKLSTMLKKWEFWPKVGGNIIDRGKLSEHDSTYCAAGADFFQAFFSAEGYFPHMTRSRTPILPYYWRCWGFRRPATCRKSSYDWYVRYEWYLCVILYWRVLPSIAHFDVAIFSPPT